MDRQTSREIYERDYVPTLGITRARPMVDQVLENKHGIDNPVIDLKVRTEKIIGNVTFDGSAITNPPVTITLQNQNGVLALQEELTLTDQGVLYANADGLIVQDPSFFFDGAALNVGRVNTDVIYATAGGDMHLDMTSGKFFDEFTGNGSIDMSSNRYLLSADGFPNVGWGPQGWLVIYKDNPTATAGATLKTDNLTTFREFFFQDQDGILALLSDLPTPGGSEGAIQFNESGVFQGASIMIDATTVGFQIIRQFGGFPLGLAGDPAAGNPYVRLYGSDGVDVDPGKAVDLDMQEISGGKKVTFQNENGAPVILSERIVSLGNNVSLGPTPFAFGNQVGLYRVTYYIFTSLDDGAAGSVQLDINWTDPAGTSKVFNSATFNLSTLGSFISGEVIIAYGSGDITWTTGSGPFGTAEYDVYMTLERLT